MLATWFYADMLARHNTKAKPAVHIQFSHGKAEACLPSCHCLYRSLFGPNMPQHLDSHTCLVSLREPTASDGRPALTTQRSAILFTQAE